MIGFYNGPAFAKEELQTMTYVRQVMMATIILYITNGYKLNTEAIVAREKH